MVWRNILPKKYSAQSNPPQPPTPAHNPTSEATVSCEVFDEKGNRVEGQWDYRSAIAWANRHPKCCVWLQLHNPDTRQMSHVGRVYNLHELLIEDCSTNHQRPKLEHFDDSLALVLRTLRYVDHELMTNPAGAVETGEIIVIAGFNYVISIHHDAMGSQRLRVPLVLPAEVLARGPAMCMYALADQVVDSYLHAAEMLDQDVDQLEEEVFNPKVEMDIDEIYAVKREVLEIKHIILPLMGPLKQLSSADTPLVPEDVRNYFRDVEDHLLRVNADIQGFDEVLSSLIAAVAAKVGIQQNRGNRMLSAWAAIVAVPTLIASIYGMNFEFMPFLAVDGAYYIVLTVMAVWSATMFWIFRGKKWI